ncbi:hypothetical protein OROHE_005627 [Orobanche hederae]
MNQAEKKEEVQDTAALESGDNLENLGQPVGVRSAAPIGRFKVKEVEKRLTLSCKFIYNHADKIMDDINHVRIQLDVSAVRAFNASKGKKMVPTFKQLAGNLKQQPRTLECGFCVCRYMKEIIESDDPDLEKM